MSDYFPDFSLLIGRWRDSLNSAPWLWKSTLFQPRTAHVISEPNYDKYLPITKLPNVYSDTIIFNSARKRPKKLGNFEIFEKLIFLK